jgi:hypothetical protein
MISSIIPTGKGGEKANYFIIIVHLLSSFIIGYHHPFCGFDSRTRFALWIVSEFTVLTYIQHLKYQDFLNFFMLF